MESIVIGIDLSLDSYRRLNQTARDISNAIDTLDSSCAALSELKILCDRETTRLQKVEGGRPHATFPSTFLNGVLLPEGLTAETLDGEIVPFDAAYVIGANRKGYGHERRIIDNELIEKCQQLGDYAGQSYRQVGRLPLYYAMEGKNRVEVFRNAGATLIGKYSILNFPEPVECSYSPIDEDFSWQSTDEPVRLFCFLQ